MMDLPRMKKTIDGRRNQRATTFDQVFGGYNHNLRTKAGEFYDMKNISLDNYPVIGTRQGFAARYLEFQDFLEEGEPHGLHEYAENKLMAVFGKTLHVGVTDTSDGYIVSNSTTLLEDSEKTFATIGTKTLIMPDKVIFDTSTSYYGSLYKVQKSVRWDVFDESSFYYLLVRTVPCDIDGKVSNRIVESGQYDDEYTPTDPTDGMWWYRGFVNEWLEYKSDRPAEDRWVKIEKPYTRLVPVLTSSGDVFTGKYTGYSEEAIGKLNDVNEFLVNLNVLDSLCISSGDIDDDGTDYVIYGKRYVGGWGESWNTDLDHPLTSIVIAKQADTNLEGFEFKIKCPDIGHIFGLNNRIWGVTPNYEEDEDEPEIHIPKSPEIFACKLGDPTQWYNYAGAASDSFALTLGNDKEVTAGCAYNNTPHFFTEDTMIKIYGDYPSNYQTRTFDTDGVISGGHDTLVQVEGLLFWVSPIGVVAYEGSLPYLRSQDFEPNYLYDDEVVAGKDGTKYCLSAKWGTYKKGIFAYDTQTGMWAKFADDEIVKASELKNALCYVNDQKQLVTLHKRNRTTDNIPLRVNQLDISERIQGDQNFDFSPGKYFCPFGIKTNGSGEYEYNLLRPTSALESTASIEDGVLTVAANMEYWEDESHAGKDYGACFPIELKGGLGDNDSYVVYYKTDDATHAHVHASVINAQGEVIGGYKNIASGTKLSLSEDYGGHAQSLCLVFCQRSETENHFSDVEVYNITEYWGYTREPIEWELETGNLGLDTPDQKYISRVQMRIDFVGSLNVDISYDDSEYLPVHVSQSDHMKSITVPIKVRRCDHFKLKLSGEGQMRLYSLGYETDEGSARCLI